MKQTLPSAILFAERNPHVRELIQRELLQEGYRVLTAKDGNELCFLLREGAQPDLVLLDPELPYLGVEDVLQCLLRRTVTLPVVLYGFSSGSLPAALESKAAAHVEKAADPQELKTTVRGLLKTRSLGQS